MKEIKFNRWFSLIFQVGVAVLIMGQWAFIMETDLQRLFYILSCGAIWWVSSFYARASVYGEYSSRLDSIINSYKDKWFKASTPPKKSHEVIIKGLRMGKWTSTIGSFRKGLWVDLNGSEIDFVPVRWAFMPSKNKINRMGARYE